MTPGPDQQGQDAQTIPRRAITPGPDWGRYNSGDEDETDGPSGAVHFRQSSYLQALDAVPGEKVHRSKTATHGGDPYYNAQRENYGPQANGAPQNGKQMKQVNQYGTNDDRYREDRQTTQQSQNNHSQGQTNGKPYPPGSQYQYIKPQTHPPVPLKPKPAPEEVKRQPPPIAAKPTVDYQDWTLSTSENYRRQNMPKSPVKEANFVFPSSPIKNKPAANMAKVNEIQRLESFKKGKGKIGVDVVRYQVRGTDKVDGSNTYGPLDPEALYPGNESGVMQTSNKPGQMPNSQSHPAIKSEANPNTGTHSNLKRTRSLENTTQAEPVPAAYNGQVANKLRPQSARPFEHTNSNKPPPPTTPKLKRPSNVHSSTEVQDSMARRHGVEPGMNVVDGKPPRPASRGPGYKDWKDEEDPYGTLSYINRKAVESILQQQKSGAVNSRVRTLSQGPGSAGSRSSNSSLESCTEQLNRGNHGLPQRPALPEALRVEIPGDNVSLGSQKDSGYRSGGSGDRNSASSMSSVSVDSPVTDGTRLTHPQHHYQHGVQNHHPHQQHHQQSHQQYQHPQNVYASADAKSHSSTDSLSSGQSGQSYATIKASSQSNIQQHQVTNQQTQQYLQSQQVRQQQQQTQQQPQQQTKQQLQKQVPQSYQLPQHQGQACRAVNPAQPVQQHGATIQGQQRGHAERNKCQRQNSRLAGDECDSVCFQAESMMEESNLKEKESDLHTAMILCQKAIGKQLNRNG